MATVSSPCVRLCAIDPPSGLCLGCGRTLDEIAAWTTMSEHARRAVMARAAAARRPAPDPLPG